MIDLLQKIPVKSPDIEILPYDGEGHLIIQKKLNYHIRVNELVINLLNLIDGKQTIRELSENFNSIFKKEITPEKIHEILYQTLGKYHIVENDTHEYKVIDRPDYLKLGFTLLSKNKVAPIANFIAPLFSYKIFYPLLVITFLFVILVGIDNYNYFITEIYANLSSINPLFVGGVLAITIFMHEFGHAAACKRYGGNHGDIGFGFYLLTPVMFADVSDVWRLKRSERIIVNLGGLFMQILVAAFFGVMYFIYPKIEFLALMYILGIMSVAFNLNPFFRTDGYWVLSDITGISNLRGNSTNKLIELFNSVFGKSTFLFTKRNILLAMYAFISSSIIILFLAGIFYTDSQAIFSFPQNLYQTIKSIFITGFDLNKFKPLLFPIVFYILLGSFLRGIYKKRVKNLNKNEKLEFVWILISILLSLTYLLSAAGKTLDFTSFIEKTKQYPLYFSLLPYGILTIEYFLAFGFATWMFRRITPWFSVLFLLLITLVYSYGYVFLGIKECDCFGSINFLNSDKIGVILIKNIILFLLSISLLKFHIKDIQYKIPKRLLSIGIVILLSFQTVKNSVSNSDEYIYKKIGHSIYDYDFKLSNKMKSTQYWFLFSPTCKHCKESIPYVNKMVMENKNVLGVTIAGKELEMKELMKEIPINFSIEKIERDELKKITKSVPYIMEIKNDTIKQVLDKNVIKTLY
ncbi:M50 family metallopeptidase [Tenacibaculum sp. TC6]|uniref:M50 family metallopeptidase n=1 Tax=Tenacibaculum sp. TC6 TaxID=3423223 RepID=UPI003D3682F6